MRRVIAIFVITLVATAFCGFDLQAGLAFSRLEQRFVLFEEDTLTGSDEFRGLAEGDFDRQLGNHNLFSSFMFSGGTETFWGRLKGRWRWTGPENLLITTEIGSDLRSPYEENTAGYLKGYGYLRAKKRWTEADGSAKISVENKDYSGESSYSYDYTLTKAKVEFGFPFFREDELSLGYQFAFRYAPDTVEANYHRNNFYASWYTFWGGNYIRLDTDAERRIYNRGDLSGNHWRVYGDVNPRIGIGTKLTLVPRFTAEGYRYDWANEVHPNREEYIFRAGGEWAFNPFIHGGIAPKYLLSHADNEVATDNFSEASLELSFDYLKYKKLWFDILIEPGLRFYKTDPPDEYAYYSDFIFVEASGFLAWWIIPGLRFDALITYSPEWHDVSDDDITTFYLSTSLKYEFYSKK